MLWRKVTLAAAIILCAGTGFAAADSTAVEKDETLWRDAEGDPTYKIGDDGLVDYRTYMGYKRYTGNCMPCHGPDGAGSTFAPDLTGSLKTIDYTKFTEVVSSGQQNVWHPSNSVMPAWGTDLNVMCYIDDIYVYLRARSDGAVGRGEPKRPPVDKAAKDAAYSCLGF
ncbi:c-type cytochrome, methanol metabolism-related [Methylobrevis pamukkalensis]|uniref:Cytochrome c-553I n=1 Tax=Methylobrevis pamukkalensis TaxID=1439726 RepID=A0A1E3GZK3_9HYPH|nr:c-type cytochrome, methanol metabolism-related [Methylobrevis pamukkalensis]ODN69518.1 Cytochrome c-553I precursor [Methylobrevis pamukkalensis]